MRKSCSTTHYASRYLLPLEICLASVLLSWGVSGAQTAGALAGMLDSAGISLSWGVALCAVSLLQLVAAVVEMTAGRRWPCRVLLWSVSARCFFALLSIPVWIFMWKFALATAGGTFVSLILFQVPMALAWQAVIFAGNLRTRCLLDPQIRTARLERRLRLEREAHAR